MKMETRTEFDNLANRLTLIDQQMSRLMGMLAGTNSPITSPTNTMSIVPKKPTQNMRRYDSLLCKLIVIQAPT